MEDSTLVAYKSSIEEVQYLRRKYEEARQESLVAPRKVLMSPNEHFESVKRDIKIVMDEPNSKQPPPMITIDLAWLDFDAQSWIVPALK